MCFVELTYGRKFEDTSSNTTQASCTLKAVASDLALITSVKYRKFGANLDSDVKKIIKSMAKVIMVCLICFVKGYCQPIF